MMKRLVIVILILTSPVQAGPIKWLEHHPKTTKLIASGVAAGVHAAGLHSCRARGVEYCDGKYGSAWAIFGVVAAANLTAVLISDKIGGWQGNAIGYGGSVAQLSHGIYEWRKEHHAKVESDSFRSLLR